MLVEYKWSGKTGHPEEITGVTVECEAEGYL